MMHAPPVTRDDLAHLVTGTQPFVSVYLDMSERRRDTLVERIAAIADGLHELGAPTDAVQRATTPLLAPPDDRGAMAVLLSSDGRSVVAGSPDPLERDLGEWSSVPRIGPVIEWSQQMITHAVIRERADGTADTVVFGADGTTTTHPPIDDDLGPDDPFARFLISHDPAAVFVVGTGLSRLWGELRELVLQARLRPDCHLERLEPGSDAVVADAVVRHAASVVATRKVQLLHDFRFERSHERAVDGIDAVIDAVNAGQVATLLLNDDPDDHRRAILHPDGTITAVGEDDTPVMDTVRLADAVMCATLARGGTPVIVPTTAEPGPADDLGALLLPRPVAGLIDR